MMDGSCVLNLGCWQSEGDVTGYECRKEVQTWELGLETSTLRQMLMARILVRCGCAVWVLRLAWESMMEDDDVVRGCCEVEGAQVRVAVRKSQAEGRTTG